MKMIKREELIEKVMQECDCTAGTAQEIINNSSLGDGRVRIKDIGYYEEILEAVTFDDDGEPKTFELIGYKELI
jgi:hypothetical protein